MTLPHPDAAITQAIVGLPMRLRAHRAAHGLSLRDVAAAAGVNHATLCRIEAGHDYTVDNLILIAAYLDGAAMQERTP